MIEVNEDPGTDLRPRICMIGVGGAGGNAVANMIRNSVPGVEFIVANTDAQALNDSPAARRIQLGRKVTHGLGAGALAAVGKAAAAESIDDVILAIEGFHLCFIAAGMGGGTGTGAAPVIAAAVRARGILTVGVVTRPFGFEGRRRAAAADLGIEALRQHVDTLIVIPNQNLFRVVDRGTTIREAFMMADGVLEQGVRSITDLIVMPGVINLDFADVRTVMAEMGRAMLGTGEASGENRATHAAELAISNPLLDGAITGARGLIISISGGDDMCLMEVDEAANHVRSLIHPDADIIWGSALDPQLDGRIRVSIVATGIDSELWPTLRVPALEAAAVVEWPIAPERARDHPVAANAVPAAPLLLAAPPASESAIPTALGQDPGRGRAIPRFLLPAELAGEASEMAEISGDRPCLTALEEAEPSLFERMAELNRGDEQLSLIYATSAGTEEARVYRRQAGGHA